MTKKKNTKTSKKTKPSELTLSCQSKSCSVVEAMASVLWSRARRISGRRALSTARTTSAWPPPTADRPSSTCAAQRQRVRRPGGSGGAQTASPAALFHNGLFFCPQKNKRMWGHQFHGSASGNGPNIQGAARWEEHRARSVRVPTSWSLLPLPTAVRKRAARESSSSSHSWGLQVRPLKSLRPGGRRPHSPSTTSWHSWETHSRQSAAAQPEVCHHWGVSARAALTV